MRLPPQTRDDYISFVENAYFGAVQAGRPEEALGYFEPGAVLTGYAGDAPARRLTRGDGSLDAFMHAAREFELTYSDFVHFVDPEAKRVASYFKLLMRPKPAGAMAHVPTRRLRNCNFFQFGEMGLTEVVAYFSNPGGES